MRTIELDIPHEFHVVVCGGCDMAYVVLALPNFKSDDPEVRRRWMPQVGVYFCPYCGSKDALAAQQLAEADLPCGPGESWEANSPHDGDLVGAGPAA